MTSEETDAWGIGRYTDDWINYLAEIGIDFNADPHLWLTTLTRKD